MSENSFEEELISEVKKLREEIRGLRNDRNDSARYERYCKLKAEGKLSMLPAIGRGMPRVPEYHEWNGLSKDDEKRHDEFYNF